MHKCYHEIYAIVCLGGDSRFLFAATAGRQLRSKCRGLTLAYEARRFPLLVTLTFMAFLSAPTLFVLVERPVGMV